MHRHDQRAQFFFIEVLHLIDDQRDCRVPISCGLADRNENLR